MKHTSHKTLTFVSVLLLFISAGVGLAGGQKHTGKAAIGKPASQQRARTPGQQTPAKWYTFTGPDGDFTMQFPSKPAREEDIQGPFAMIRRYSTITDTHYLGIVYQDVGPEASVLKPTHEEANSALLQEKGYKVVSMRRLSSNTTEMELWSPSQTPGRFLHRIDRTIVSHGRMYTLGCGSRTAEREVSRAVCRRFFDSLRIIGVPQER